MNQDMPPVSTPEPAPMVPTPEAPARNNTWLYVAIAIVVLCCCCIVALVALYLGYDKLGDPLHIYGSLLQSALSQVA